MLKIPCQVYRIYGVRKRGQDLGCLGEDTLSEGEESQLVDGRLKGFGGLYGNQRHRSSRPKLRHTKGRDPSVHLRSR